MICGCRKVTREDLENAIKNGAKSFEEVQEITKVGTGCGRCLVNVEPLVKELLEVNK